MSDQPLAGKVSVRGPEQTKAWARRLAAMLQSGDVVVLEGNLGAGKTLFVKGLASGLGIPEERVSSPTFSLMHEYREGRIPLYHFDLYRLPSMEEVERLDPMEYLGGEGVAVLEWGGRAGNLLPENFIEARIECPARGRNGRLRTISFTPRGVRPKQLVEELTSRERAHGVSRR